MRNARGRRAVAPTLETPHNNLGRAMRADIIQVDNYFNYWIVRYVKECSNDAVAADFRESSKEISARLQRLLKATERLCEMSEDKDE